MTETYLYIYRNDELGQVYIGIGASVARVWGSHNSEATELLKHSETKVFVTAEPFPDRQSAERAESAAICAAAASRIKVISEHKDLSKLTNIAKVASSKHLTTAVYQREGTIRFDDLRRAAIVVLRIDSINDGPDLSRRPGLHGGRTARATNERAVKWWGLGAAQRRRERLRLPDGTLPRDIDTLVAVQTQTRTILGAWALSDQQWRRDEHKWTFLTTDEIEEMRGQTLDWGSNHPGQGLTWSKDIRLQWR